MYPKTKKGQSANRGDWPKRQCRSKYAGWLYSYGILVQEFAEKQVKCLLLIELIYVNMNR